MWSAVISLGPAIAGTQPWRAILVEERDRQRIRVALWAPDDRVRWVAALAWDAGLGLGSRSACIARARRLARDAMKCAGAGADLDAMPRVELGLSWTRSK